MTPQPTDAQPTDAQPTDLYFDFLCPYAWRGVEMAHVLRGSGEGFRLRHFSLVQGNHPQNKYQETVQWWLTDQPLGADGGSGYMKYQRPSLNAFLAAHAAARQGEEKSWAFALVLWPCSGCTTRAGATLTRLLFRTPPRKLGWTLPSGSRTARTRLACAANCGQTWKLRQHSACSAPRLSTSAAVTWLTSSSRN